MPPSARLFLGALLFSSTQAALVGALPVHLAGITNDTLLIGVLIGLFAAGSAAFQLFGAFVVDRLPFRASLLAASALLCAACLFYWATPSIGYGLALARIVHGVALGLFYAGAFAWLAVHTSESSRGQAFGFLGMGQGLAVVAMPAIGLFVRGRFGMSALFAASLAVAAMTAFCAVGGKPPGPARRTGPAELRAVVGPLLVALLAAASTIGILEAFLPFLAAQRGADHLVPLYIAFGAALTAGRVAGGWASDRFDRPTVVFACAGCSTVALAALSLVHGLYPMMAIAVTYGLSMGGILTVLFTAASHRAPADQQGRVMGLCALFVDFGVAGGAGAAGLVALYTTAGIPWMAAAASALAGAILIPGHARPSPAALHSSAART